MRLDLWVGKEIVVEVKAVEDVKPVHRAQLLTYLRLAGCRLGLLANFNVARL
jgi:GxxExxY protein